MATDDYGQPEITADSYRWGMAARGVTQACSLELEITSVSPETRRGQNGLLVLRWSPGGAVAGASPRSGGRSGRAMSSSRTPAGRASRSP